MRNTLSQHSRDVTSRVATRLLLPKWSGCTEVVLSHRAIYSELDSPNVPGIASLMVYLPPPPFETPARPGYERAYNEILSTHRRSPLSSASSVIVLVAPDVDALCAARMLADLFKQDDIMHRIIPVPGMNELERIRDDLITNAEVRTLSYL